MNLHGIVSAAIGTVNPHIDVSIRRSIGAIEDATGRSIPGYADAIPVKGQKQPVSGRDIERLQQQGIQGVSYKMYLDGNYEGLFRVAGQGGDLLDFGGQTYAVASVMERWPDWCCLAITLQNNASIK